MVGIKLWIEKDKSDRGLISATETLGIWLTKLDGMIQQGIIKTLTQKMGYSQQDGLSPQKRRVLGGYQTEIVNFRFWRTDRSSCVLPPEAEAYQNTLEYILHCCITSQICWFPWISPAVWCEILRTSFHSFDLAMLKPSFNTWHGKSMVKNNEFCHQI